MANPPKPVPTDPDQHAPGVSRTLEENAAGNRERRPKEPEKQDERDDDLIEERERV